MLKKLCSSLFILLLIGCKESETVDFGYDYFPQTEGNFVEYDVLEVFHDVNVNPQHDTMQYRLKTVVGEEMIDNTGRAVRKFFRYKYDLQSGELFDQRVWTSVIDDGRGELVEENQRKIKLVFAVKADKVWDVNAFNEFESKEVYYSGVNEEMTFNNNEFEQTVTVNYEDFFSLVDYRKQYEVYAKGVGLVKKSFKDFTIENFDTTAIQKGTELHYELINYGVE
ncbi:hypothetical protein [Brumimicrobium aurantiacum]|uniref:Uncharacterized protein n=1 Tax=Brumimicrobium aurantiacum TaxID=1737063 RepID=A0A3E1EWB8_9FLAO|nr:hypothetical protein [Brumimicrobium aurantiacum]RFC53851.1 hypothetical protein DXU93_09895 [Brumimicrobium aurantiacum]